MNYELTLEQAYKVMKPLFDRQFEGSEVKYRGYSDENDEVWFGVWKGDDLLLGYNTGDFYPNWYSNGNIFYDNMLLFSMEPTDFYEVLLKYMNENYPELDITAVY